jgi:hypothetical protein
MKKAAENLTKSVVAQPDSTRSDDDTRTGLRVTAVPGLLRTRAILGKGTTVVSSIGSESAPSTFPISSLRALQRKRDSAQPPNRLDPLGGSTIPSSVLAALRRNRGGGRPLPDDMRAAGDQALKVDLSPVRVHTGPEAANLARSVQAVAFTHGTDIYFSAGAYRPAEPAGRQLIAHELGHVGQSTSGDAGRIGRADDPAEAAADRAATGVISALQRQSVPEGAASQGLEPVPDNSRSEQAPLGPEIRRMQNLDVTSAAIRRSRPRSEIFNVVDQNAVLQSVSGAEMKRVLYWNEQGKFDVESGGRLTVRTFQKWMRTTIPIEEVDVTDEELPDFMSAREEFGFKLPAFFGGGKLTFRKRLENRVFQGNTAWISENAYWRSPTPPRVQYMIHAILEWAGIPGTAAPTPHITLRNADTQAIIDLDITHPLPEARVKAEKEVTRASYAQGLGQPRSPGINMVDDQPTFVNLTSAAVQAWLTGLTAAAQAAVK